MTNKNDLRPNLTQAQSKFTTSWRWYLVIAIALTIPFSVSIPQAQATPEPLLPDRETVSNFKILYVNPSNGDDQANQGSERSPLKTMSRTDLGTAAAPEVQNQPIFLSSNKVNPLIDNASIAPQNSDESSESVDIPVILFDTQEADPPSTNSSSNTSSKRKTLSELLIIEPATLPNLDDFVI